MQVNERPMKKKVFNIRVTGIYRWLGYHAVSIVMTDPGRKVRLSTDGGKACFALASLIRTLRWVLAPRVPALRSTEGEGILCHLPPRVSLNGCLDYWQ